MVDGIELNEGLIRVDTQASAIKKSVNLFF